jgi:mono/diheme cytochrome c family protein
MRRVIVAAAILSVAACGGGGDAGTNDMANTPPTQMAPPPPPTMGGTAALPEGVTQEMVTAGQQIFTTSGNCFTCHGQDGSGTPLAPNLRDQTWLNVQTGSFDEIVNVINTGVNPPKDPAHAAPMPPKGGAALTDEQVRQVAAYVYSISHGG